MYPLTFIIKGKSEGTRGWPYKGLNVSLLHKQKTYANEHESG